MSTASSICITFQPVHTLSRRNSLLKLYTADEIHSASQVTTDETSLNINKRDSLTMNSF